VTPPIILIGPICAGKSTVAALLAQELGLPRVELDEIRWPYYTEAGFDQAVARELMEDDAGIIAFLTYCKPFEAHAVARVIEDYPDTVIDFGAGHSVYEDAALFTRVEQALAPVPHVFLLLPSPQPDESVAILNTRFATLLQRELGHVDPRLLALNEHFVRHPSNARLAKRTFYTEGRTPQETCAEMAATIRSV
jgi:hypothetical protein